MIMLPSLLLFALIGASGPDQVQVINAPAGAYSFVAAGPVKIIYTATSITFTWDVPPPVPAPAPTPAPTPIPTPVPAPTPTGTDQTPPPVSSIPTLTGAVWAVAISDPAAPAMAIGPAAKAAAVANGIQIVQAKPTDPIVESWLNELATTPPPVVLFVQDNPKIPGHGICTYKTALPATDAGLATLLGKVRGK